MKAKQGISPDGLPWGISRNLLMAQHGVELEVRGDLVS